MHAMCFPVRPEVQSVMSLGVFRSLNMNLVACIVKATIPLPMVPFIRHKDDGLDGCLEFGCDMCKFTRFEVEVLTQHYSASVTTCSFFELSVSYFSRKNLQLCSLC